MGNGEWERLGGGAGSRSGFRFGFQGCSWPGRGRQSIPCALVEHHPYSVLRTIRAQRSCSRETHASASASGVAGRADGSLANHVTFARHATGARHVAGIALEPVFDRRLPSRGKPRAATRQHGDRRGIGSRSSRSSRSSRKSKSSFE